MRAFLKNVAAAAAVTFASVAAAAAATVPFNIPLGSVSETFTVAAGETAVLEFEVTSGAASFILFDGASISSSILSAVTSDSFTGLGEGTYSFTVNAVEAAIGTYELVSQTATFGNTPVVPLPAGLPLLLGALGVAGLMTRRRKAA